MSAGLFSFLGGLRLGASAVSEFGIVGVGHLEFGYIRTEGLLVRECHRPELCWCSVFPTLVFSGVVFAINQPILVGTKSLKAESLRRKFLDLGFFRTGWCRGRGLA